MELIKKHIASIKSALVNRKFVFQFAEAEGGVQKRNRQTDGHGYIDSAVDADQEYMYCHAHFF